MGHIDPATLPVAQRIVEIGEIKTLGYAQYGFAGTVSAFSSALLCNWMVTLRRGEDGINIYYDRWQNCSFFGGAMWLPIMTFFALWVMNMPS